MDPLDGFSLYQRAFGRGGAADWARDAVSGAGSMFRGADAATFNSARDELAKRHHAEAAESLKKILQLSAGAGLGLAGGVGLYNQFQDATHGRKPDPRLAVIPVPDKQDDRPGLKLANDAGALATLAAVPPVLGGLGGAVLGGLLGASRGHLARGAVRGGLTGGGAGIGALLGSMAGADLGRSHAEGNLVGFVGAGAGAGGYGGWRAADALLGKDMKSQAELDEEKKHRPKQGADTLAGKVMSKDIPAGLSYQDTLDAFRGPEPVDSAYQGLWDWARNPSPADMLSRAEPLSMFEATAPWPDNMRQAAPGFTGYEQSARYIPGQQIGPGLSRELDRRQAGLNMIAPAQPSSLASAGLASAIGRLPPRVAGVANGVVGAVAPYVPPAVPAAARSLDSALPGLAQRAAKLVPKLGPSRPVKQGAAEQDEEAPAHMRGWEWKALQQAQNDGESQWFPRAFPNADTPATELLAGPGRQALLASLVGAGLGGAAGHFAGKLAPGHATALTAGGAGLGGLAAGAAAYTHRRDANDKVRDALRHLAPGATVGDARQFENTRPAEPPLTDAFGLTGAGTAKLREWYDQHHSKRADDMTYDALFNWGTPTAMTDATAPVPDNARLALPGFARRAQPARYIPGQQIGPGLSRELDRRQMLANAATQFETNAKPPSEVGAAIPAAIAKLPPLSRTVANTVVDGAKNVARPYVGPQLSAGARSFDTALPSLIRGAVNLVPRLVPRLGPNRPIKQADHKSSPGDAAGGFAGWLAGNDANSITQMPWFKPTAAVGGLAAGGGAYLGGSALMNGLRRKSKEEELRDARAEFQQALADQQKSARLDAVYAALQARVVEQQNLQPGEKAAIDLKATGGGVAGDYLTYAALGSLLAGAAGWDMARRRSSRKALEDAVAARARQKVQTAPQPVFAVPGRPSTPEPEAAGALPVAA